MGGSISGHSSTNIEGKSASSHDGNYSVGVDKNISTSDAHDFRDALNTVKNYSQTHSLSKQNTDAENLSIQMGADLNNAQRLSSSAQFIKTHSDAINTNFSQAFANYVQSHYPQEAHSILSATGDSPLLAKQQQLADQFIQTHAKQLANQFSSSSSDVQRGFHSSTMQHRQKYAIQNYQHGLQELRAKGKNLGVNAQQAQNLSNAIKNNIEQNKNKLDEARQHQSDQQSQLRASGDGRINKGKTYAQKGITKHITDKGT